VGPIRLAAATPADVDAIVALERRCFDQPWGRISVEGELAGRGSAGLLLREGPGEGAVRAYIFFRVVADEIHIHRIAVAPERRRRALAGRLLSECLRAGRRAGARAAVLEVRAANAAALALYRRFGFEVAATRPGYYSDGQEDALILHLTLCKEDS
jgi:ribosomal-protein-alanine N-acetyltransferase